VLPLPLASFSRGQNPALHSWTCDDGVFGVVPFLKVSYLEVIVALIVIFDGRPPPLGGRLAGRAKSGDVKLELLRRGCSSATITQSGLSFVRGGLLLVWLAVIGDGALVLL